MKCTILTNQYFIHELGLERVFTRMFFYNPKSFMKRRLDGAGVNSNDVVIVIKATYSEIVFRFFFEELKHIAQAEIKRFPRVAY